jgi:chemotaxis family two-component system sensor kinase Cph1
MAGRETVTSRMINEIDLQDCAREPIHIPGSIQPQGFLLVLEPETTEILQASDNTSEYLGLAPEALLGKRLDQAIGTDAAAAVMRRYSMLTDHISPNYLATIRVGSGTQQGSYHAIAHETEAGIVLEVEVAAEESFLPLTYLHPLIGKLIGTFYGSTATADLMAAAADEVRTISGFDRVLIYEFDAEWNGTVVAESGNGELPSYMDLRFPASDIPAQARELYRRNPLRLIADVDYIASRIVPEINPKTNRPLNMTFSVLRSVSPIHREYMRNMDTASSMSVSILRNGELWGLISCHSRRPRHIGFDVRSACGFIAQILSVQVDAHYRATENTERIRSKSIESSLLAEMATRENFIEGLTASDDLLRIGRASGAAVLFDNHCQLKGKSLDERRVRELADWLHDNSEDEVFHTSCLSTLFPPAAEYAELVSGVLAIRISKLHRSYVLWFRPEVIETVQWGGDPRKPVQEPAEDKRIHPRKSFERWKETVRGKSREWSRTEIESATDLRNSIVGIVLRKAEEMAELSSELERSNKELEAFSYSVSHDLRAPFRHIVGYSELLKNKEAGKFTEEGRRYIETIIESARFAGSLVDNLLQLSRITRTAMYTVLIDLNQLVRETQHDLAPDMEGRHIEWHVGELPTVSGDPTMLRMVMRNLIGNAIKYTQHREVAVIAIDCKVVGPEFVFSIRDNGVGFDMRYVHKLFGVFQRLHRQEDFEGTGVGLANVRRIISRHRGRTWAEGKVNEGATFYFTLPLSETDASRDRR